MSNEVVVFFMGMCMWWLKEPGPYALIPDLAENDVVHSAFISAPPSAFPSNKCPDGFDTDAGQCGFVLNGAGKTGGVHISFLTDRGAAAFMPSAFCNVPKLSTPSESVVYTLLPDFTPPSGAGNAAWMSASGGTPLSQMEPCPTAPDCPRFVTWSVPAPPAPGHVVLSLGNLKNRTDALHIPLTTGAQIMIVNLPAGTSAAPKPDATTTTSITDPLTSKDWCQYFEMVGTAASQTPPDCLDPSIPPPCTAGPTASVPTHATLHALQDIATVACSNSQYP